MDSHIIGCSACGGEVREQIETITRFKGGIQKLIHENPWKIALDRPMSFLVQETTPPLKRVIE
jgi:hypothetical protein